MTPPEPDRLSKAEELVRRIGQRCDTIGSYPESDREAEAEKRLGEFYTGISRYYGVPLSELR